MTIHEWFALSKEEREAITETFRSEERIRIEGLSQQEAESEMVYLEDYDMDCDLTLIGEVQVTFDLLKERLYPD